MLSWIVMSMGEKLGDKNKLGPPVVDKKEIQLKDNCEEQMKKDLFRADDDGLLLKKDKVEAPLADQDSDCWSELWQNVSEGYSRIMKSKPKGGSL